MQTCNCLGIREIPPVLPEMLSEDEVRHVVDSVFAGAGVTLSPDVEVRVPDSTIRVVLDGYDSAAQVGYEHIGEYDGGQFPRPVRERFDLSPDVHVAWIEQRPADEPYVKDAIAWEVRAFIDSLRGRGLL
jgi:hypothetical protein